MLFLQERLPRRPSQLTHIATSCVVRPRYVLQRSPPRQILIVKLNLLGLQLLSLLILRLDLLVELRFYELVLLKFLIAGLQ